MTGHDVAPRSPSPEAAAEASAVPTGQSSALGPTMYGWTFHQSHDQATVLFLVPQTVSSRDLDITIGSDYIIAAIRSHPPIIKARLYGQINTATSTWRIGDKGRTRSSHRSRSLRRASQRLKSAATQSSAGSASKDGSNSSTNSNEAAYGAAGERSSSAPDAPSSSGQVRPGPERLDRSHGSPQAQRNRTGARMSANRSPPSFGSLEASTSSLRSGSSYEVLQTSAAPSFGAAWSSSSSDVDSHGSSAGVIAISTVLSEPEASTAAGAGGAYRRVSRLQRVRSDLAASMTSAATDEGRDSDMHSSVASLATGRSASSDPLASETDEAYSGIAHDASSAPSTSSPSGPVTEASMIMEREAGAGGSRGRLGGGEASVGIGDDHRPPAVRLVTIHLDKVDTGIWPLLVVGPAPLQVEAKSPASPSRRLAPVAPSYPWTGAATESLIAARAQTVARERSDQRRRNTAEKELVRALGEALGSSGNIDRGELLSGDSRATVQAYLESLSTSMDDPTEGDGSIGPSTSTLSIDSIASDESATVLGTRTGAAAAEEPSRSEREEAAETTSLLVDATASEADEIERLRDLQIEAKYNMDPTTLSLIGLQVAQGSVDGMRTIGRKHNPSALPEAFEYFARAWRIGDIALAVERLVQDYLPPLHSPVAIDSMPSGGEATTPPKAANMTLQSSADTCKTAKEHGDPPSTSSAAKSKIFRAKFSADTQRQRLIASLGGTKALARLYLSYARLQLPSSIKTRSPLAFPLGQLSSPFVTAPRQSASMLKRKSSRVLSSSGSSRASSAASPSRAGAGPSQRAGMLASIDNNTAAADGASPLLSLSPPSPYGETDSDDIGFLACSGAAFAVLPGPLQFLEEAIRLDESVRNQITETDWNEALDIDEEEARRKSMERRGIEQAEEMGILAGESLGGDLVFDSDNEQPPLHKRGRQRKRAEAARAKASSSRRLRADGSAGLLDNLKWMFGGSGDGSGSKAKLSAGRPRPKGERSDPGRMSSMASSMEGSAIDELKAQGRKKGGGARGAGARHRERGRSVAAEQEGGTLAFVSGAALLSVALAGSVAAVGWWRRASGALPSAT
ncbi:hypothetical protein ACQY0O_006345 [Thecaphora frezii]